MITIYILDYNVWKYNIYVFINSDYNKIQIKSHLMVNYLYIVIVISNGSQDIGSQKEADSVNNK